MYSDDKQELSTLFRIRSFVFMSADSESVGAGLGFKGQYGAVILSANTNKTLKLNVIIKPETLPFGIDLIYIDNLESMKPNLTLALNYYIWERFALRIESNFDAIGFGVRRSF